MGDVVRLKPGQSLARMADVMEAVLNLRPGKPLELSEADARLIIAVLRKST